MRKKKKNTDSRLLAMALLLWAGSAMAQPSDTLATRSDSLEVVYSYHILRDSASVNWRPFDSQELKEIQESKDFQYIEEIPNAKPGLLEEIWKSILRWFVRMLFDQSGSRVAQWIIYGISGIFIVYAVLKIAGIDTARLFTRRTGASRMRAQWAGEEIHGRNFEEEIQKAVAEERFQDAIRLHYLHILQKLSDKELIAWKIDKTNRDYWRELKDASLRNSFAKLTTIFEKAYYGHFPVNAETYARISPSFSQFVYKI